MRSKSNSRAEYYLAAESDQIHWANMVGEGSFSLAPVVRKRYHRLDAVRYPPDGRRVIKRQNSL